MMRRVDYEENEPTRPSERLRRWVADTPKTQRKRSVTPCRLGGELEILSLPERPCSSLSSYLGLTIFRWFWLSSLLERTCSPVWGSPAGKVIWNHSHSSISLSGAKYNAWPSRGKKGIPWFGIIDSRMWAENASLPTSPPEIDYHLGR